MKELWALSIKTSLPEVCENKLDLKTNIFAYEDFETAKIELRKKLRQFAFSKNSMFDGKGDMIHFNKYIEEMYQEDGDEDVDFDSDDLTKPTLNAFYCLLKGVFEGKDQEAPAFDNNYCSTDGMVAVELKIKKGILAIYGDDDGPCNGYSPEIYTNMLDMTKEKDYYLYVDDLFGQDDASSELYIDLQKVQMQ